MPSIKIEFTSAFERQLRLLAKKYRHIKSDIQTLTNKLQTGEILGDQVPGIRYTIFKVRVQNKDLQKGKRSGYRVIYYLKTAINIILISIYSKSDQSDISAKEIKDIINNFDSHL